VRLYGTLTGEAREEAPAGADVVTMPTPAERERRANP
jgi:hypothetical protein